MIQSDADWQALGRQADARLSPLVGGRFFVLTLYPGVHEEAMNDSRKAIVDQFWRHVTVAQARMVISVACFLLGAALSAIYLAVWIAGGWG